MKTKNKFQIFLAVCLLLFSVINLSMAHSVTTPRGTSITHSHPADTGWYDNKGIYRSAAWWTAESDDYYEGDYIERLDRANRAYNCHAYAWADARQSSSSTWCWINTPEDDKYMDGASGDKSYREVSSSIATYVSYASDDHSLLVYSGTIMTSKWGSLPCYKHYLNSDPYNGSNPKYYRQSVDVPEEYSTIQSALAAAVSGQTVHLSNTQTLSSNVTILTGVTLQINSGATVNLSGYHLTTQGTGKIVNNGTISNSVCYVTEGSDYKGYYPTISSGLANTSSGQTLHISWSSTLSSDLEAPSGVTLSLESGVTLTLNGNNVTTSSGTIALQGGSTVIPNIQRKNSSGVRKGLYPTISDAIDDAATNDEVYLGSGSFTEDVDMPGNFELRGNGRSATTINGDVTFDHVSSSTITDLTVNGEIVVDGGSSVYIHNLYAKDVIDIDLGSSHDIWMVTTQNSGYIELYCTSPLVDDIDSYNSESCGITAYGSDYSSSDSYFEGKTSWATYCTSSSDPELVGTEFCNNDFDIYVTSGCTVDASEVTYFSYCDPAPTDGSGTVTMPDTCSECPLSKRGAGVAGDKEVGSQTVYSGDDKAREQFEEALVVYRGIQAKMREDRKNGRPEAGKYAADFQVVANKMRAVVDGWPQTIWAEKALRYADYSYRALGRDGDITTLLNDVQKKSGSEGLFLAEKRLRVADFIRHQEYENALTVLDELIEGSKDNEEKLPFLYRQGVIYQKYLKDADKASAKYSQVIAADAASGPAMSAQRRLEKLGKGSDPGAPQGLLEGELELSAANYPNPANPGTTIRYALPGAGVVGIRIYNMNGQRVADLLNADMPAGRHTIRWDGRTAAGQAAATGVYFYRLQFGEQVLSHKFLLLR